MEMNVLLLALTCERVRSMDTHLVDMLMSGDLNGALRIGLERLERASSSRDVAHHAALGQLLGRALLAADRAEDAEELFQRLPKTYESISRASVRWLSSLDQGALSLHLGRAGRAAEAWHLVAADESAPMPLRVEAMAGLAAALLRLGEHRQAVGALAEARRLASQAELDGLNERLQALEVELDARLRLTACEGLADYALSVTETRGDTETPQAACEELEAHAASQRWSLVAHSLQSLRLLLSGAAGTAAGRALVHAEIKWLREHGYAALESSLRIDAALTLLARDDAHGVMEVLGALAHSEQQSHRHRHALDVLYCVSRLHAIQGRHGDALRTYKEFAREALYRTARERAHLPRLRFLERQAQASEGDAAMFRLPLRYRRAYRYIIEHLADTQLSIKQVAAHIDVTERALQMAFRKHLGMTPAELIRHQRMQGIRNDLCDGAGSAGVLKTAARWGMANRSTLAQGYRQLFSETPTATLRGQA